ncbi:GGDEF domain-containing protein [Psychromonas algarum]|uniref:GGDEF domain-containing protein n=1 Tax=Psychromonas algarum TaxID=2555643 RepID=UPI00141A2B31|nr:GGDEF domain-containing protein [Psychromonas sp. RZ22]
MKHNTVVHKYLLSAFFFLFLALLTDSLDEIFIQPWLLTALLEDLGQVIGFILLFHGINTWITQNSVQTGELKKRSETDELTELYTRSHFNNMLNNKLLEQSNLSILLINIDNFKTINEQYGQSAGDIVLKRFANKLKDCVRKTDIAARWNGEEFIVLLIGSDNQITKDIAELIRENTELLCVEYNQDIINITVSIGVASYQDGIKSCELIHQAEQCLSEAKSSGKNKVLIDNK